MRCCAALVRGDSASHADDDPSDVMLFNESFCTRKRAKALGVVVSAVNDAVGVA